MLAANAAQLLDMSSYSKKLGVSVPTVKRWLSILEASYIIFLLPPYYDNFGKRLIKSPKVYFWDTGLVAYLTGIKSDELFEKGPMAGSLFENYVVADIYKQQLHDKTHHDIFYLRTSDRLEVDLILDKKQSKQWIEIKKSATFVPKMLSPIKKFITKTDSGYLLYRGERQPPIGNIHVLPYGEYLNG